MLPPARILLAAAALAFATGCSRSERSVWPARNYSGIYAVKVRVTSNDCLTPVFAPGDTLQFALLQSRQNRAQVDVAPVASLAGDFHGDRLEAYAAVSSQPTGGPAAGSPGGASPAGASDGPNAAGEAGAADSIRYRLTLDFEGHAFKGTYRVEQPALGNGLEACKQAFDVEGMERPAGTPIARPIRLPSSTEAPR